MDSKCLKHKNKFCKLHYKKWKCKYIIITIWNFIFTNSTIFWSFIFVSFTRLYDWSVSNFDHSEVLGSIWIRFESFFCVSKEDVISFNISSYLLNCRRIIPIILVGTKRHKITPTKKITSPQPVLFLSLHHRRNPKLRMKNRVKLWEQKFRHENYTTNVEISILSRIRYVDKRMDVLYRKRISYSRNYVNWGHNRSIHCFFISWGQLNWTHWSDFIHSLPEIQLHLL